MTGPAVKDTLGGLQGGGGGGHSTILLGELLRSTSFISCMPYQFTTVSAIFLDASVHECTGTYLKLSKRQTPNL